MALLNISEPGDSRRDKQQGNPNAPAKKHALGIDLGTTNSIVASANQDGAFVIEDSQGDFLLPSVVHYGSDGSREVGQAAYERSGSEGTTVSSVKRLLGRGASDIDYDLPYKLVPDDEGGMSLIRTAAGDLSPVEVSADILKVLAERGQAALGGEIEGVVITVPAYFDEAQRQSTKNAARIAGLNVLRLLAEPTAAAVAYGLDSQAQGNIVIYDLGGGTFDVSLMKLEKGVFEVLATGGNSALGGDDLDRLLIDWILEQSGTGSKSSDLSGQELKNLARQARQAKHTLTDAQKAALHFKGWTGEINRETFNALADPLIDETIKACRRVLRDAGLKREDVTDIVMVGGSTRTPRVQQKVSDFFGRKVLTDIDPDKVVALGAAIQADILVGNKYGRDLLLLDVIPLSLGIETMGGLMEKIIPRNTTIPVSRAQEFTTFKDGQSAMGLHVLQGERELVSDCRSLARFELRDIPPMVAGAARIRVTFQVDADGLLSVQAQEMSSGVKSSIEVKPSFGLEDQEVESMIRASQEQAARDKDARALREAQVEALRIIEATQSALASDANLLNEEELKELTESLETLRQVADGDDTDLITARTKALNDLGTDFAARRMDTQIRSAFAGKKLEEIDK